MPGFGPATEIELLAATKKARPYISGKRPKTIDAPPGHIEFDGRRTEEEEPTRYAQTRPA